MTFVNKDAEWLLELAGKLSNSHAFNSEQAAVRLSAVAERLERLDEQVRNVTSMTTHSDGKTYADGVRDAMIRYYGRSNLPIQSVALDPEVAAAMETAAPRKRVKVTKVPTGMSGEEYRNQRAKAKAREDLRIIINLDKIKLEI